MKKVQCSVLLFVLLISYNAYCNAYAGKIIIEIQYEGQFKDLPLYHSPDKSDIQLESVPYDFVDVYPQWTSHKQKPVNNRMKFVLYSDKPLLLASDFWFYIIIANPGDSLHLEYVKGNIIPSGTGAEGFRLQEEIGKIMQWKGPTKHAIILNSSQDYWQWLKLCDRKLASIIPLIESKKRSHLSTGIRIH